MNLFNHLQGVVVGALQDARSAGEFAGDFDLGRIAVEPPRDPLHGDAATNAAMVLAKAAGIKPRALAELLAARIARAPGIAAAEVAGPGFINIRLAPGLWYRVLEEALALGADFGRSTLGAGERVNCEYVSANPTGPLHVGHCRGAVFGDALARLLAFTGHEVVTEYYMNDAGGQVDVLARSAFLRYREALGEAVGEIPAGLYPGDYLKPVGRALAEQHGSVLVDAPESVWLPSVKALTIAMMMTTIREDLKALGIVQDVFTSEKALHDSGAIASTVAALRAAGHVYDGRLPPPKGEMPEDWEDREQTLFRASAFGDDTDRPLMKSNGDFTYFAADVAYARDKIERGFTTLIYVLGADHGGYVKRLEAVAAALGGPNRVKVVVKLCQLVKLYRGGEPVRMSKRAGEFVTVRDLVDDVGPDVARFIMLYRKNEAPLDFDFAKATEQSKDNPVFYVQYAHARICSVLRNAGEVLESGVGIDFSLLTDEAELALVRRVAEFPRLLEQAAQAFEPHRVSFYLYDLASDFHALWNKGKESPQLRFIKHDDVNVTQTRLAFLRVIRYVLANGLSILGVRPVEEM